MKAIEIIQTAGRTVENIKAKEHGDRKENFSVIAKLWESYLNVPVSPEDVAILMTLLKIGRINTKSAPHNDDNFVDAVGYMSIAGEFFANLKKESNNGQ